MVLRKLTKEEQDILNAKPADEPDHAKTLWKKRTWKLSRGKTTTRVRTNRPNSEIYWSILRKAGKNVNECENCTSDYRLTIHHRDGNPFNNSIENLQVLCWHCHLLFHDPTEEGVHDELEGTKNDFDNLDDPEIRKFYGIVQEDIPEVDDEEFSEE
jgi:hypothetical protein